MWRPDRAHSKLCRDFWKKVLTCIFGCPKLHLGQKKLKKKISNFFTFHRGDPYDFSRKNPSKIFLKNHKGPPYEKWKKFEIFFFNFFCPRCSLGPPKMHFRNLFEKSLHNFECLLFRCGEFWKVWPLFPLLLTQNH